MPRVTTDLTPLLPAMRAARETVTPGQSVPGTELAELAGVTWRILKMRIRRDAGFPVMSKGANGRAWKFDPAEALDYMIADLERQIANRQGRARRVARQAGLEQPKADDVDVEIPEDSGRAVDDPLDVAASARSVSLLANAQMSTHRLKQMQGEFVRAVDHARVIATIMSTMQTETLAVASHIDPAGTLPPDLRKQLETELKNVLLAVKAACDRDLRTLGAREN